MCKDCNSSNKYNVPSNKPYLCHLQDIPPVSLTASNTTASWFVIAPALTHQHATAQEVQRQDQKAPTKESSLRTRRQSRDTLIWGAANADNKTEKSTMTPLRLALSAPRDCCGAKERRARMTGGRRRPEEGQLLIEFRFWFDQS